MTNAVNTKAVIAALKADGVTNAEDIIAAISKLGLTVAPPKRTRADLAKRYVATDASLDGRELPRQLIGCVQALKNAGKPLTLKQWAEATTDYVRTQQSRERIVAYYKKTMLTEGLIKQA